jgi:hypothetical protein
LPRARAEAMQGDIAACLAEILPSFRQVAHSMRHEDPARCRALAPPPPTTGARPQTRLARRLRVQAGECPVGQLLHCRLRGGSNHRDRAELGCSFDSMSLTRGIHHTHQNGDVGFRCCRDVEG